MNSINSIHSYIHNGMWVFDDESRELDKEPFVEGADLLLDVMSGRVNDKSIETCSFYFGATPIPNQDVELVKSGEDGYDGTYYKVNFPELNLTDEGPIWLCPALLKFFETPPENIYVRIRSFE
tara:strand:+ start:185 stop:553 length:369 start_codon:yes stop_codon:yes gene_type:complete